MRFRSSLWIPLLVFVGTMAGLRLLTVVVPKPHWIIVPLILASAAWLGCRVAGVGLPVMGLARDRLLHCLKLVAWVSLATFPLTSLAYWAAARIPIDLPRAIPPSPGYWAGWLFYQFAYIGVTEEFFFRGYLQHTLEESLGRLASVPARCASLIPAGLSVVAFAAAHWITTGQMASLVTFFPGLVLAWLYLRTHCLLAPILYHGLANCFFAMAIFQ